jgi:hypothetical protein
MKIEGLSPQQVSRILKTTMALEHNNRELECEEARLDVSNKQAAKTFQQLNDLILKGNKIVDQNFLINNQLQLENENLNIENARLENFINSIQLNNETCFEIKLIAKQEIESIISNPRKLLRLAW